MIDKNLFKLLGKNKKYIILIIILMIIGMLSSLLITFSICKIFYISLQPLLNNINPYTINQNKLINYIVCGLLGVIAKFITTYFANSLKDILGRKVKQNLREQIYDKIIKIDQKQIGDLNLAGLTQVSIEGIEQLDIYFSNYLPQFFYSTISPFILFLIYVFLDYKVAILLICLVPLIPISIVAVSKYAKKIFAKYWGKYTSMGDLFLDGIQGLKDLKIFQYDADYNQKLNISAEEFRKITMKVLVMQLSSVTIMDLVAYLGAASGICLTISELYSNNIAWIIALFIMLTAVEFFLPLRTLGSYFHIAMNGISAGKKIQTILDYQEIKWGENKLEDVNIEFKNVTFSYNNEYNALNNISLKFPCKGISGICGQSGSGKSTIVKLLLGEYKLNNGQILIGDKDLYSYSKKDYYSHIGLVSYNTYIFNETIKDNFKMYKEDITDQEIYNTLKQVNLYDYIIKNGGLDKTINEDANNISGGQKQRLALALNLVVPKKIYIFDEATSNIDIESEEIIFNTIYKLASKANVIVISHRLENIVKANNIYYLDNGQLIEQGNFDELISLQGGFYKQYMLQSSQEKAYLNKENI